MARRKSNFPFPPGGRNFRSVRRFGFLRGFYFRARVATSRRTSASPHPIPRHVRKRKCPHVTRAITTHAIDIITRSTCTQNGAQKKKNLEIRSFQCHPSHYLRAFIYSTRSTRAVITKARVRVTYVFQKTHAETIESRCVALSLFIERL